MLGLIEGEVTGSDREGRKEEINVSGSISPAGVYFCSDVVCKLFSVKKELNMFPTEQEASVSPIWRSEGTQILGRNDTLTH